MKYFTCADVNGQVVMIESLVLYDALRDQGFKLFGMGLPEVLEFRRQYQLRNGPMPITKEQIPEVLNTQYPIERGKIK